MVYDVTARIRSLPWIPVVLLAAAMMTAFAVTLSACQDVEEESFARAYQATHRTQLIGGPGALGEIGDWVIENDEIRVVIQDISFNRGTGLFGGSLIDADVVRQDGEGDPFGGNGRDSFGEAFPAFFLEVIDPEEIVIVDAADLDNPDIDDDSAVLEVRGRGGEFVTMLRFFNQAMVNAYDVDVGGLLSDPELPDSDGEPLVQFTARYILEPGASHIRLETEMANQHDELLEFPHPDIVSLAPVLGVSLGDLVVPTGSALGFGAMNDLFVPGIGYDIRFGLEDLYATSDLELPAIPGQVTDVLATSSTDGVSYGFASAPDPDNNFVSTLSDHYGDVDPHDMLFLFEAAGYGGAFTHGLPEELEPEETFTAVNYFVVGSGDVASIRDEVYRLHDQETTTVTGRVYDETTGEAAGRHANIFFYEKPGEHCHESFGAEMVNQTFTNRDGYFELQLPPGDYCFRSRDGGSTSGFSEFEVDDETVNLTVNAPSAARVEAMIVDQTGNPVPAKMTVVGEYEPRLNPETDLYDLEPRHYLYDLSVGERWRTSESVDFDPEDDSPRRFIENIEFSSADGRAAVDVEPGDYTVYFSRGSEYDLVSKSISVGPGQIANLNAQLTRQINPDGYLSADYHLHAAGSIDSGLDYNDRVISVAGEGVEVAVATDHNYISDYTPYILRNNLQPFLRSIIGLELTTMEAGHFNAFPLRQDIASPNRGSVAWQNIPPQEIFDNLREMGSVSPEDTIIQVNHPRDSILGYFNQHYVDALTGVADLPVNTAGSGLVDQAFAAALSPNGPAFVETIEEDGETEYLSAFSYDFDAIEIYNGKRMHLLHHFRMPPHDELSQEALDHFAEEGIDELPAEGVILCDDDEVAFPGGLDDWYNFLNYRSPDGEYRRYTATGNSDSHHYGSPSDTEPGFPRNYFYAGHNDPHRLTPQALSEALQNHHNIVTNGPFINMSVDGQPVGSTVSADGDTVTLDLEVQVADWIVGDGSLEYTIVANGERLDADDVGSTIELDDGQWSDSITIDLDDLPDVHHAEGGERDTWFVLEVEGDNNLFPVVQPAAIPPVPFDEALGAIAEPFGFGDTVEGLVPDETTDVYPLAFTNPIWVVDGDDRDEFEPPEPPHRSCEDGAAHRTQLIHDHGDHVHFGEQRLDAQNIPLGHDHHSLIKRDQGELRDVRAIFDHWHLH